MTSTRRGGAAILSSHIWVELIAFDVDSADLGVAAYLADVGHVPESLSLLLYSAEFLHAHDDGDDDRHIPVECTAYGARPLAARGPRQDWTQGEVRRLVSLLRDRGIAVLFAVFDLHAHPGDGTLRLSSYAEAHPELAVVDRQVGRRPGVINPLSRRRDGLRYAEWFTTDLGRVLSYYGFSGWHAADGLTSTRVALWQGDFGVAFVRMFAEAHPGSVPTDLLVDDSAEQVAARGDLLWGRLRTTWIAYHAERFADFWAAAAEVVHRSGGLVMANNGWTRDPFEALYRFGSDYDRMLSSGVDRIVLEASAGAIQLLEERLTAPTLPWIMAATMISRQHLGTLPLIPLIGVHDWYEGWDVIGDARPMLQRDLWTLTTPRQVRADGVTERCVSGLLWCLGDSLSPDEWTWLDQQRTAIGSGRFDEDAGPALLYDPVSLTEQVAAFVAGRSASPARLLERLLRRGADLVRVAAAATDLPPETPVVVLRADLHTDETIRDVASRFPCHATLSAELDEWVLRLADPTGVECHRSAASAPGHLDAEAPAARWMDELAMSEPAPELIDRLARWICEVSASGHGASTTSTGSSGTADGGATNADADVAIQRITRRRDAAGVEVALINNTGHYTVVDWTGPGEVTTLTSGTVIRPRDLSLGRAAGVTVQLPPSGVSVVRASTSDRSTAPSTPSKKGPHDDL